MTTRLGAVAFTVPWCGVYQYVVYPMHCCARLGEQYSCESIHVTINGDTSRSQWACHQFLLNALACSVFWSPPDVVHHWGCRLASLHRGSSNPGCPWAPKPYVHLPGQRLALGSSPQRSSRGRTATCLHEKTRLASWHGSLSLGTYDAQTSCIPLKRYKMAYLFCEMHNSFWEVSGWPATTAMENAPVEEQQPAPVRRQYVLVERTVWAWEHMMHKQAVYYRSFTGWNTAEGGYGRLHLCPMCIFSHTTDHRILGFLYMFTLASVADPRLFDPRVCDDKTYITTPGMQQTFAHGRTT